MFHLMWASFLLHLEKCILKHSMFHLIALTEFRAISDVFLLYNNRLNTCPFYNYMIIFLLRVK